MHVLKLFEEYVSGTEQKVGIVSTQTRQLLADVSKLLSPIHSKYRQICLFDEWEHFKMERDIDCPNIMKDFHVRNFINSYNSISIKFLTHIIWTIYDIFYKYLRWTQHSHNARLTYNHKDEIMEFVESKSYKKSEINSRVCHQISTALKNPDVILELGFLCYNWTHICRVYYGQF